MKNLNLTAVLLLLIFQSNIYAQKTIQFVKHYEPDGDTIAIYDKECIIEEKYQILRKNKKKKIKHGRYERYSKLGELLETGNYRLGKKVGVWQKYIEDGLVCLEYDYDQNKTLEPIVFKGAILRYPIQVLIAIEESGELPKEGDVVLKIDFDENCHLIRSELVKTSHEEFNTIVLEGFRKYVELMNKYGLEIEECTANTELFPMSFRAR
ncbi:MAG: hypothetical protein AB8B69_20490 [Chitinophagales bacterium]